MPKLIKSTSQKFELPSSTPEDEAWVYLKDKLSGGTTMIMATAGKDNAARTVKGLTEYITDWNFTFDGTPDTPKMEINVENVNALSAEDFNFIVGKFTVALKEMQSGMTDEQKKTSSSTLTSSTTPETPPSQAPIPSVPQ